MQYGNADPHDERLPLASLVAYPRPPDQPRYASDNDAGQQQYPQQEQPPQQYQQQYPQQFPRYYRNSLQYESAPSAEYEVLGMNYCEFCCVIFIVVILLSFTSAWWF